MKKYGIDIDDPANIVKSVPNKGHTIAYAKKVWEELSAVEKNTNGSLDKIKQAIITKLVSIGSEIRNTAYM